MAFDIYIILSMWQIVKISWNTINQNVIHDMITRDDNSLSDFGVADDVFTIEMIVIDIIGYVTHSFEA